MSYKQPALFYLLAFMAVAVLALGLGARVLLWRNLASTDAVRGGGRFLRALLGPALFQTRLLRLSRVRWLIHMAIFWGFLLLFVESLWLMVLKWGVPEEGGTARFFADSTGEAILALWGDVWGLVLLIGLVAALVRRYAVRSPQLQTLLEDAVALWFLLVVTLTGFAAEGARLALEGEATSWAFLGRGFMWVKPAFGLEDPITLFWIHGILSLLLIAFLPYSKLAHVFAAPAQIALRRSAREGDEPA